MITKHLILILCIFILLNASLSVDPETYLRATYGDFEIGGYSHKTFNFTEYYWFSAHNDTNITHSKCRYIHNSLNAPFNDTWEKYVSDPIFFKDTYACIVSVTDGNRTAIYLADYDVGTFKSIYNYWGEDKRLLQRGDHNEWLLNGSWYDVMAFNNHLFIAFNGTMPDIPGTNCLISTIEYFYDERVTIDSDLHNYVNIKILDAINDTIGNDYHYKYVDMNSISYIEPHALNQTVTQYWLSILSQDISDNLRATLTELVSVLTCETEKCYITKQNYESLSYPAKARLLYSENSYACFAFNKNNTDAIKIMCVEFEPTAQLFKPTISFEYDFERNRTNLAYLKIHGDSFIFNREDHYFFIDLKYKDNTTDILMCNFEDNNCKGVNKYVNHNLHTKKYMNNPYYATPIAVNTEEIIKLSETILHTKNIQNGNALYTTDQYFNCFRYEYQSQTTHNWIYSELISYCNGVSYSITADTTQLINITNTVTATDILDILDNYAKIEIKNTGKRYINKVIIDLQFYDGSKQIFYRYLNDFQTMEGHDHKLSVIDLFVNINKTAIQVPVLIALYDQYNDLIYYEIVRFDFLYGDTFITLTSNGEQISEFMINGDIHYNVYAVPDDVTEIIISVANRIKPTIYKLNPYQTGYLNIDMESYHWISRSWYPYFWENTAILSIYENDSIDYFKIMYADPAKDPVVIVPSLAKLDLLIDFLSGDDTNMLGFERTKTDPLFQFVFDYDKYITTSDEYIKICIKFTNNTNLYCSNKYKNNTYYVLGKGFIIMFLIILIVLALTAIYITKIR